ncbi:MAG: membrane protein insertase YidC [Acidimicrobiales bacterium]
MIAASIFEGFFKIVADFLGWLYQATDSYGGAIVLLTVIVMAVTAPLTLKSTRSMLQMQRHQPELKKLQAKYKDDRERLNTEMMAFYKENGINPLSGCVPVLMQAPIFIVLYQVLRGITTRSAYSGAGIGRVAGNLATNAPFAPWKLHDQVFAPQHLSSSSAMFKSLAASTKMNFFGVDLSLSPLDAVRLGIGTAIPFLILMALMLGSQIIQNRQIQGRNKNAQVNPQQQAIMKFLPFMLPIFSFQFPAGLGLYYFVQGLCRIGLQGYITKAVYAPHHEAIDATATEKDSGSKAAAKPKATSTNDKPAAKGANGAARSSSTPKSAKSAAAQRKASGASPSQAGRKSGDPRASGRSRPGTGSSDSKRG